MSSRLPLSIALIAALALAGCGVKGPLEMPPGAPQGAKAQADGTVRATTSAVGSNAALTQAGESAWGANPPNTSALNPPDMPGDSVNRPPSATSAGAKKSFFLDFLL